MYHQYVDTMFHDKPDNTASCHLTVFVKIRKIDNFQKKSHALKLKKYFFLNEKKNFNPPPHVFTAAVKARSVSLKIISTLTAI